EAAPMGLLRAETDLKLLGKPSAITVLGRRVLAVGVRLARHHGERRKVDTCSFTSTLDDPPQDPITWLLGQNGLDLREHTRLLGLGGGVAGLRRKCRRVRDAVPGITLGRALRLSRLCPAVSLRSRQPASDNQTRRADLQETEPACHT